MSDQPTPEELYMAQSPGGLMHQTEADRASQFGAEMPGQQMSPQMMRQMRQAAQRRRQMFEERRRAREQQRAMQRIKQQVVYAPAVGMNPKASGYEPMPRGLNVRPDPKLGIPFGVDVRSLSPKDQAIYMQLAMNSEDGT